MCASFLIEFIDAGDCNELENLINKERRLSGRSNLHCDPNMRWVAYKHLDDADEAVAVGKKLKSPCNLHSWLVKFPCCFTSDFSNNECMWNKAIVS